MQFVACAQTPLPDSFHLGANSQVTAFAEQGDGKILLGGSFSSLGGQPRNFIARINADGSLDAKFSPNSNGMVNALAILTDNEILVGGNKLHQLNTDGSLDTNSFNLGPNDVINALAIQSDGKILVGGSIGSAFLGNESVHLGRLNTNGSPDTTFTNPNPSSYVNSIAIQADGKILIGGAFTWISWPRRQVSNIARLNADGSLDTTFNPNANSYVTAIAVQADGAILAGGAFTNIAGQIRYNIARLYPDGSLDTNFNPNAAYARVDSLALQADGKILVGGLFNIFGGQARKNLARLNPDGSLDTSFNPSPNGSIKSLALQSDGKVLVGGAFTAISGQTRYSVARLYNTEPATQSLMSDGSTITWLRGGTGPEAWRTTFEISTNGVNWAMLGSGARIPGGWQMTGLALSSNVTIRARGFIAAGYYNASGWFVQTFLGPPAIGRQPVSLTNNIYSMATLTVEAVGSTPLYYQWHHKGTVLTSATNCELQVTNFLSQDTGDYFCVVSNAVGSITSAVATMKINDPFFSMEPRGGTILADQNTLLSVTALGSEPLFFQWQRAGTNLFDGANIFGATTARLTLTSASVGDSGWYSVIISNASGIVTSSVAILRVENTNAATIGTALDAPYLNWSSGGAANWFAQTNTTYGAGYALRSGSIADNQQSWLQTDVAGPCMVSFYWKVSSEQDRDWLTFFVDDVRKGGPLFGEIDWQRYSVTLEPGPHKLQWFYAKDNSFGINQDCAWVDLVSVEYGSPGILSGNNSFGFAGKQFGFNFHGGRAFPAGTPHWLSIFASTNVQNWVLVTNALYLNGAVQFTDPDSAKIPNRFYRIEVMP